MLARWIANAPLAMIHQYVPGLRKYDAIALDAGAQDRGISRTTRELAGVLAVYDILHTVEIYDPGDHVSHVGQRVEEHVLPFFSRNLSFEAGR